jgi:hypothetical protein
VCVRPGSRTPFGALAASDGSNDLLPSRQRDPLLRDRCPHSAREPEPVNWLVLSIVASVVLTVVLNLAIRLFPGPAERGARRVDDWAERQVAAREPGDTRTQVIVPWKAMLIGSLVLTVGLNLLLWLVR